MPPKDITNESAKTLYQAILVKSLDILSAEEEEELDALLDTDTTTVEDVLSFLKSKIPTFDLLVLEERKKLKEGFVSVN
ncbi:MAG: hypothetical protein HY507_00345 [Candidatus Zambryskibacteria bacterium]|nr:hypothetical protein [Candidatus Zambryskibacteria bacterium]